MKGVILFQGGGLPFSTQAPQGGAARAAKGEVRRRRREVLPKWHTLLKKTAFVVFINGTVTALPLLLMAQGTVYRPSSSQAPPKLLPSSSQAPPKLGRSLGGVWEELGRSLGGAWEELGRSLGCVPPSKDDRAWQWMIVLAPGMLNPLTNALINGFSRTFLQD
eukprot:gene20168-biopygen14614